MRLCYVLHDNWRRNISLDHEMNNENFTRGDLNLLRNNLIHFVIYNHETDVLL